MDPPASAESQQIVSEISHEHITRNAEFELRFRDRRHLGQAYHIRREQQDDTICGRFKMRYIDSETNELIKSRQSSIIASYWVLIILCKF